MGHKTALSQLHGTTVKPIALLIYPGWMQLWTWEKRKTTNKPPQSKIWFKRLPHIRNSWQREGFILCSWTALNCHRKQCLLLALGSAHCLDWLPAEQHIQCGVSHRVRTWFHLGNTAASGTRREVMGWGWEQLSSASSPGHNSCYKNIWTNCWGF